MICPDSYREMINTIKRIIPNQIKQLGIIYYIVGIVYLRKPNFSIKAL